MNIYELIYEIFRITAIVAVVFIVNGNLSELINKKNGKE